MQEKKESPDPNKLLILKLEGTANLFAQFNRLIWGKKILLHCKVVVFSHQQGQISLFLN